MIAQISLFEINDQNELVMTCKAASESSYQFNVPSGYEPSKRMPRLTMKEWIVKVRKAAANNKISKELASKIETSLLRLPDLYEGQKVCVSFSLGKDSEAIFLLAAMRYPLEKIMSLFADTQDEWPESYQFKPIFEKWVGVPIHTVHSMGIHTLLRERIPVWPKMGVRHCTKFLKMLPQRDYLDEQGFDQVRKLGSAKFRPTYGQDHLTKEERQSYLASKPKATFVDVRQPAPLMLSGERWAESESRAKLPYEEKDGTIMRVTQRPVLEFTIEEIWDFIFWMQAPYNPVYHYVKRCACAGCPFASRAEIETLGKRHPDRLQEWVKTEIAIGHPWKKVGYRDVAEKIRKKTVIAS